MPARTRRHPTALPEPDPSGYGISFTKATVTPTIPAESELRPRISDILFTLHRAGARINSRYVRTKAAL